MCHSIIHNILCNIMLNKGTLIIIGPLRIDYCVLTGEVVWWTKKINYSAKIVVELNTQIPSNIVQMKT